MYSSWSTISKIEIYNRFQVNSIIKILIQKIRHFKIKKMSGKMFQKASVAASIAACGFFEAHGVNRGDKAENSMELSAVQTLQNDKFRFAKIIYKIKNSS